MTRIRVAIRVKPESGEKLKGFGFEPTNDGVRFELTASGTKNEFNFDHVFDESISQHEVFNTACVPIIHNVLDGFNGTLFAYGQTGAGKTHTVTGPASEEFEERGLCMRAADYLFRRIRSIPDFVFTVKFSVIEIYNDNVMDLLRESLHDSPKLVIVDTPDGVIVPALYLLPLENEEEAYTKLYEANVNRSVAEHQLNRRSSRSHVIYSFYLTRSKQVTTADGVQTDTSDVVQSKLHLVDLAGSERIEKTGSKGGLVKEATHINKSLSFLEQVVLSLTKKAQQAQMNATGTSQINKKDFVPAYRSSKLTYILKDSLGGNCNTVLIACVWPHCNHLWETLSTLRFATRMRCIENHPHRNSLVSGAGANSSTRALQVKIESLKRELALRDMIGGYTQVTGDNTLKGQDRGQLLSSLTKAQHQRCVKIASQFALNNDDKGALDVRALCEVQAVASTLRYALWEACEGDRSKVAAALNAAGASNELEDDDTQVNAKRLVSVQSTITEVPNEEEVECANDDPGISDIPLSPVRSNGESPAKNSPVKLVASPPPVPVHSPRALPVVAAVDQPAHESPRHERNDQSELDAPRGHGNDDSENQNAEDAFGLFKQNDGLELHENYENIKQGIKEAKARQRVLVNLVNTHKASIDVKTDIIQQINSVLEMAGGVETENVIAAGGFEQLNRDLQEATTDLTNAKNQYKKSRTELIRCKEQIAELTLMKQQALNTLVKAFEEYTATISADSL